jgi:hypothetical protein
MNKAVVVKVLSGAIWMVIQPVMAHQQTVNAPTSTPTQALSTTASLDFTVNLGKFLFFQLGTDNYPTTNSPDTITFQTVSTSPTANANGNDRVSNWGGSAPTFGATSSTNALTVKVKSNAGQISLKATVASALSDGTNTLPMNNLTITSSSTSLPAPTIPASGSGANVTVTGTSFSNLVTDVSATWTFNYTTPTSALPGTYQGQVTFTATSP